MEDMLKKLQKHLDIKDVDFRIQSINKGGYATILAYKNARTDMNRLDEVCKTNWQDKYELIDGELFCSIGIKIEDEWIWRQDVGVESFTEKTKGRASDAFKRAGFRWGIGRELYDYPLIQVKLNSNEFTSQNGKQKQTWNLKLRDWIWNAEFKDKKIVSLSAKDEKGNDRFNSSNKIAPKTIQKPTKELKWLMVLNSDKTNTPEWLNVVNAINQGKINSIEQVKKHYKIRENVKSKLNELFNYQQV